MKIAILSDIKSNVYALQAVIQDAKSKKVDTIINLGDSFYGPIAPRACFDLLKEHKIISICGDEDRKILEASLAQLEKDKILKFVYEDLKEEALYWIQDLGFEKFLNKDIYFTHGTQHDDSKYLLEDVRKGVNTLRNESDIIKLIDDVEAKFVLCGHSLKTRCINLSNGQVVMSPGSVGLQAVYKEEPVSHKIENGYTQATYIVLELEGNAYNLSLNKVEYDYSKAITAALKHEAKSWAYTLKTGKLLTQDA